MVNRLTPPSGPQLVTLRDMVIHRARLYNQDLHPSLAA